MAKQWMGCANDNFERGRPPGLKPEMIVLHIFNGSLADADARFDQPGQKVSAHYAVGQTGEIHQYVEETDTAFHAAKVENPIARLVQEKQGVNPNFYSIGIEHEGKLGDTIPQAQLNATAALLREIADRWNIFLDRDHVIAHSAIRASANCPGSGIDIDILLQIAKTISNKDQCHQGDAMSENSEPMIKLEPGGVAPILSYNVSEPTSYSGRNFIDLQIDQNYFREDIGIVTPPAQVMSITRVAPKLATVEGQANAESQAMQTAEYHLVTPSGVLPLRDTAAEKNVLHQQMALGPELKQLTVSQIDSIEKAGLKIDMYRSMSGALAYQLAMRKRDDDSGGEPPTPSGPPTTLNIKIDITSPKPLDKITGPSTGVSISVTGGASERSESGAIKAVDVKIGSSNFQRATNGENGDWSEWSFTGTTTLSGSVMIIAKATHTSGKTKEKSITVNVVLVQPPAGVPADQTPPNITITTPSEGSLIILKEDRTIDITGTAFDADTGIKTVDFWIDGDQDNAKPVTPKSQNDWSNWTASKAFEKDGKYTLIFRGVDNAGNSTVTSVNFSVSAQLPTKAKIKRLVLAETYGLSSFLGRYGAGRTLKTFSLLPGEKTKISIKTWEKTSENSTSTYSILDSFNNISSSEFENATAAEQAYKENYDESMKYVVRGGASATWGWGSANISGEVAGGTNSAREEFAKNISNATQKHTATASAKRDIQINTSTEKTRETGEETAIERTLENVNVSRTLNFVFRQMNQEFITLLHLTDVRVGFVVVRTVINNEGKSEDLCTYREATLPQLDSLLKEILIDDNKVSEVRGAIKFQLQNIFDYSDSHHSFIEEVLLKDSNGTPIESTPYYRVKKGTASTYRDPATGTEISVPGIILAANKYVMRTEGIIVDSILGQGDALDSYSHGLQDEAVRTQLLNNSKIETDVYRQRLAVKIVEEHDRHKADVYSKVFPSCPEKSVEAKIAINKGADIDPTDAQSPS